MSVTAFIPAAGSGRRTGSPVPKQFIKVFGKEILAYTLEVFQKNKLVNNIIVAANPDYIAKVEQIKKKYNYSKLRLVVQGGKERQDSVHAALLSFPMRKNDLAVVHDAARPLLSQRLLTGAIEHALKHGSALVAMKSRDTLLDNSRGKLSYPDRNNMYSVQTPQIFRYGRLLGAFTFAAENNYAATDESMLMHYSGYSPSVFEGEYGNFKITSKEDIELFRKIVRPR